MTRQPASDRSRSGDAIRADPDGETACTRRAFGASGAATLATALLAVPATAWPMVTRVLPPTPPLPAAMRAARARLNGIPLWYAVAGEGPPVLLLHGGLANANYWGNQIDTLRACRSVIVMDSRGHGRSERDHRPLGYDLMADDVVALLGHLGHARVDVVGWSDGAIIGLDLAMRYPTRIGRVFAFAGNTRTDGARPTGGRTPPVLAAFFARAAREYAALSPTPQRFPDFLADLRMMWRSQPNWTDTQLQAIRAPVLIAAGDRDEAIRRAHTDYIAATIPAARSCILRDAGHFALLQDPGAFNAAMLGFLA